MTIRRIKRGVSIALTAVLLGVAVFLWLNVLFPLPSAPDGSGFAVAVVAEDGTPLRAFPDENGVWRYPVHLTDISPLYLEALINYEDRGFRYHPGVNPWALARAAFLYVKYGRAVSGGSTLTMQVARILDPHTRNVPGKIKQIFRALQLELTYSKDEILEFYINFAPFGGTLEGVEAASFAYLNKPARELSHAEAALLAVLPQAPSRLRPDRHPDRSAQARDKVLDRLAEFKVWDEETVADAKIEQVLARCEDRPLLAPLLARRLKDQARPGDPVRTTIDYGLQESVADLVQRYIQTFPPHTSAAVLVVENRNLAARAYVGSSDFLSEQRYGHVDMVTAERSPGSLLKPFLYALAMEEGLIHSESLLVDAPFSFGGYRPGNFNDGFVGPVSASEALYRSLNIPAVDVLDHLGPGLFDARLRQGGLYLNYPTNGAPNLSMILGGVGTNLESLVGAYSALGRDGLSGEVRLVKDAPIRERRLLTPGAAYIVRRILSEYTRDDLPSGNVAVDRSRQVAWKTGTSYGYRDAWAVGVTDEYSIGVWVGRPDGTPSPGQYGRATAAPLLFRVVDCLPRIHHDPPETPKSVSRQEICWPLGTQPQGDDDPLCHQRRTAWILNNSFPPTFPDRADRYWLKNPMMVTINPDTGMRVDADCPAPRVKTTSIARWPKAAGPWLTPELRAASAIPPLDPICGRPVSYAPANVQIVGLTAGSVIRPQGVSLELPTIMLSALGGNGRLFWLLNGDLVAESNVDEVRFYRFERPGRYHLTVMDLAGNYDDLELLVLGGSAG